MQQTHMCSGCTQSALTGAWGWPGPTPATRRRRGTLGRPGGCRNLSPQQGAGLATPPPPTAAPYAGPVSHYERVVVWGGHPCEVAKGSDCNTAELGGGISRVPFADRG